MKNLYLTGLLFLAMFLTSCLGPGVTTDSTRDDRRGVERDDRYYEDRRRRDPDRNEVFDRSRTERYPGKACEDESRGHDCQDQCRDIYTRRGDKEDCEELSVDQIERLHELHDILEKPDDDDLANVDFEDFDVYLNISIAPLDKLIGRYTRSEAKEFMLWLIEDEDASQVFEKEDDEYSAFEALLEGFAGSINSNGDNIWEPFVERIEGDKLMELAIESGNEETLDWFMDYINEKNSQCEDEELHVDCFKIYCKIGDEIDDDYRDDWLGYENFEDYIEDIISEGINSDGGSEANGYQWGGSNNVIEELRDVDDWVDDLCKRGNANLVTS